jgi:hypothetical protein
MSGATRTPPIVQIYRNWGVVDNHPPAAQKVSTPAIEIQLILAFCKERTGPKKKEKKGEELRWWLVQSRGGGENFCFSPLGGPVSNIILPEEVLFSGELFHFVK